MNFSMHSNPSTVYLVFKFLRSASFGVIQAKPDMIFSREKRKAITLPEEVAEKPS